MSYRDDKLNSRRLSASICEDALEEYQAANDTLAGLIERSHLDVREFMILSFVCDQGKMTLDSLLKALGLSRESTWSCVVRLGDIEMLTYEVDELGGSFNADISATSLGRAVTRRIHAGTSA